MTDLIATIENNAALLEAAAQTATGKILAWPSISLGVRFEGAEARVTGVLHADVIVTEEQAQTMPEAAWAHLPAVANGRGEWAVLVDRKQALLDAAASCRQSLADLKAMAH